MTGREVESGMTGTRQIRELRCHSGFCSFTRQILQLMSSGSSQSVATPPPPPTVPFYPSPGINGIAAWSRIASAQDPSPLLPTIHHCSATSGSGITTFSAALSITALAADSQAQYQVHHSHHPLWCFLPQFCSCFTNLLSGNISQGTIPRPRFSLNATNQNLSTTSLSS